MSIKRPIPLVFLEHKAPRSPPEVPSGRAEGQQPQQHRVQSPQRWVANALGKRQFAADTGKTHPLRLSVQHSFPPGSFALGLPRCLPKATFFKNSFRPKFAIIICEQVSLLSYCH